MTRTSRRRGETLELRTHGISRCKLGTDGHGVTDLVSLAGCPLSCRWCLNKSVLTESTVHEAPVERVLSSVMREACYFVGTGGGVAFGGGEPLLQWEAIREFAGLCPDWMRITVETALQAPAEAVEALVPHVDIWMVDIKTLDPKLYEDYTGGSLGTALANLGKLAPVADRVRVRVPVMPGLKDEETARGEEARIREMGFADTEVFEYVIR